MNTTKGHEEGKEARIEVVSGPLEGRTFSLPSGEIRIGRHPKSFLEVADRAVSQRHVVLIPSPNGHVLHDERSANGTFVNGRRVEERLLCSGDLIRIGKIRFRYSLCRVDRRAGRTFGGYRIDHEIGRGAMATVYRAVQVELDRSVALKVLSKELTSNREFVERFLEEARSAARLNHPHIVQVYDVGESEGLFYISMEFLPGGNLRETIRREGRLPPPRALPLLLDTTRALMCAEEHGIVHRDIKPSNLLLDVSGNVKVGDFGLAQNISNSRPAAKPRRMSGSPSYMAPEQALGHPVDHRADLYALGSTMYTALSGRTPFRGRDARELLLKKLRGPPPPLATVAPEVPRPLARIADRLLAPDPNARYQSAPEVYRELSAAEVCLRRAAHEPRRAGRPLVRRGGRRGHGRVSREARRRSIVNTAGPVVVVIVAAFIALRAIPPRRPDPPPVVQAGPDTRGEPSRTKRDSPPAGAPRVRHEDAPGAPPPVPVPDDSRPDSLPQPLGEEIDLLLLDGRFPEALERLEQFRAEKPGLAARVEEAVAEVRAANLLHEARAKALRLERRGNRAEALAVLEEVRDGLPEELRAEAVAAMRAIEETLSQKREGAR